MPAINESFGLNNEEKAFKKLTNKSIYYIYVIVS